MILCLFQGLSKFIYCSITNNPVASTGQWMEVPYFPGHCYVNIPSDSDKGGQPSVTYQRNHLRLEKSYPYYAEFQIQVGF